MIIRELHWLWLIIAAWIVVIGPGTIEGSIFPAAAPMVLTETVGTEYKHPITGEITPALKVWGTSARLRPECRYRRIDWFQGHRNANNVPVDFVAGKAVVRKDGAFSFGPWFVAVASLKVLTGQSFSDVLHRCYYFGIPSPWLTRSRFWN